MCWQSDKMYKLYGYCHHHNICTQWECIVYQGDVFCNFPIFSILNADISFLVLEYLVYGNSYDFFLVSFISCLFHVMASWFILYGTFYIIQSIFWCFTNMACYIFFMDLFVCFGSSLDYLHMKTQPHASCFIYFILAITLIFTFLMGVSNALLLD